MDDAEALLATNVVGTNNVFEAARESGVRRIVLASSGATTASYETEEPFSSMVETRWADVPDDRPSITHADLIRPRNLYAVTKVFGEARGRYYADASGSGTCDPMMRDRRRST